MTFCEWSLARDIHCLSSGSQSDLGYTDFVECQHAALGIKSPEVDAYLRPITDWVIEANMGRPQVLHDMPWFSYSLIVIHSSSRF